MGEFMTEPTETEIFEQVKDRVRSKIDEELLSEQKATNSLLKVLLVKKDIQIDNQIQFKRDWIKAKTRSGYFSGVTFLLMTVAIVLDIVKIDDLFVILDRISNIFG
jgi:hypothetical protein